MKPSHFFLVVVGFLSPAVAGPPPAADPGMPPGYAWGDIVRVEVSPERVEILGGDRCATLVVTGIDASGGLRDLTGEAAWEVVDPNGTTGGPSAASVSPDGLVRPLADGSAEIRVKAAGREARVPVTVGRLREGIPINFSNDLVPVFSRYGCNAGGCHGKSGGQNGFQLSLFGYVPSFDYAAIVRDARGRRIFPAAPEHSLLVRKATGLLPHGGGERFPPGSDDARLLSRWIGEGLPFGKPEDPVVERIEVVPARRTLPPGSRQRLRVVAVYSDGRREDVTRRARYSLAEEGTVEVDASGWVTALDRPGEGAVLVNHLGRLALFRALVPLRRAPGASGEALPRPPARNFIDRLVFARLDLLGIPSSDLSSDAEFLRRASLDLAGTAPTAREAEEFLSGEAATPEANAARRARLVDRLLESPEHAAYSALLWADLLRNQRGGDGKGAPRTIGFHAWLRERFERNVPYDRLAREILTAEGCAAENPPVAWYAGLESPKELADDTAQVFLGTRIQCARCHHHPRERWAQEDYWRFAAIFARLERKGDRNTRRFAIAVRRGESRVQDDEPTSAGYRKGYAGPKLLGGAEVEESPDEDPRARLADWLASPENPFFARAAVNRAWKHFLGRGIVEPEDDLRETNPPSNPELLDALAEDFRAHGFDLRHLARTICASSTYQLSAAPRGGNERDRANFARYQPRRLEAEVLLDAIDRAAGTRSRFSGFARDARAIELADESSRNYFLETFGKPERASACACERSGDLTLPQVIHLLNSRELEEKLESGEGTAQRLAKDPRSCDDRIRELYLAVLSRPPRPEELAPAREHLEGTAEAKRNEDGRRRAWEDLLWALLNSKEFLFER